MGPYKEVRQGTAGILLEFGRFIKTVGPGWQYVNPYSQQLIIVSLTTLVIEITPQSVVTKDNVNIIIEGVVYYRIIDPFKSQFRVANVHASVIELTHSVLRDVFGKQTLQECLEHRTEIGKQIKALVEEPSSAWGIVIESMLIKDIRFSEELQVTLSAAAKAKRLAESKIITAEAEVKSAELMRKAADILASDAAMQIRYLDTLTSLAKSNNTKVIFMPLESNSQSLNTIKSQIVARETSE